MFMNEIIEKDFLEKYKGKQPNWGFNGLGYIVYKRTYARTKENGETEEWYETVARCINGAQKIGANYSKEEAQKLFDLIFNLKCNFAGRMLWQLGTSTVDRFGANSLLNCFSGDTEIVTSDGIKKIKDVVGKVELMSEYGRYIESEVRCFGKQKLWKLELTRGKSKKTQRRSKNSRRKSCQRKSRSRSQE